MVKYIYTDSLSGFVSRTGKLSRARKFADITKPIYKIMKGKEKQIIYDIDARIWRTTR